MYDELVKALRICEVGEHCDLCPKWDDKQNGGMNVCQTAICKEAADAIEELSKPKITTKADEIRAMTDEELAEWIERIRVLCANEFCGKACPLHDVCFSFAEQPTEMLDWLKQEGE